MPSTQKVEDFLYGDISYKIRGACFEVYGQFGGGFKEKIVDKALTIALKKRDLRVDDQRRITLYYESEKVGTYVPDKIVNNKILLELKCKPFLTQGDKKQFWFYLKGSEYKLGFLINFGPDKLEIQRRIYDKARPRISVNQP